MAPEFIVDETAVQAALSGAHAEPQAVRDILAKALAEEPLRTEDVAALAKVTDQELLHELFDAARCVKERIYGRRLVLFAPLYISNLCGNECAYCAFRAANRGIQRRALNQAEIAAETRLLVDQGHKRVLLVAGESYPAEGFEYVRRAIAAVYGVRSGRGEIRRVNINVAPLTLPEFRELKQCGIGTYQLFQETYHRAAYRAMHRRGRKADYDWRVTVMDRAMEAGIDDVGIGALFGLYDWRFELLALLAHARYLEGRFGAGPHTISVPRIEPAVGSTAAGAPPAPVSDEDFQKMVAILRLAVPYTGIIMSTRESPAMRRATFALGVSQISAGSRTSPGGYGAHAEAGEQFSLGDHRPLDEVVRDICELGYIPSFCTACYRMGRTGSDFMELARPGAIKAHCDPNALATFREYLLDCATPETRAAGERLIARLLEEMQGSAGKRARVILEKISAGSRDVYY